MFLFAAPRSALSSLYIPRVLAFFPMARGDSRFSARRRGLTVCRVVDKSVFGKLCASLTRTCEIRVIGHFVFDVGCFSIDAGVFSQSRKQSGEE